MYLIGDKELGLLKSIKEQELSSDEGEFLLENRKIIEKYIRKKVTDIQIGLGLGQYREKEQFAYAKIESLLELITELSEIENAYKKYNELSNGGGQAK